MSDIRKYMKERDAKITDKDDEDLLEKKLKSHRRGKISKVIILIAIIAMGIIGYFIYLNNKVYTSYEIVENPDKIKANLYKYIDLIDSDYLTSLN